MPVALILAGIAVALYLGAQSGVNVFGFLQPPPPPAPPVSSMPWANGFSGGVSIGIAGPDASSFRPDPQAAAAAAPPVGAPPPAAAVGSGPTGIASAQTGAEAQRYMDAQMGGADWSVGSGQPLAGSAIAPPPGAVIAPTAETRSGRGHF